MASQIRFEPHGVDGLVASGTSIAAAAERLGVAIELKCGGVGECTSCAVRVVDGPFSLSPLTDSERRLLSETDIAGSLRLGCQARIGDADCTIHVLDVAERPQMPEAATDSASETRDGEAHGESKAGASTKESGWFGFDSWSWATPWSRDVDACPPPDASSTDPSSGEAASDRATVDEARRRILEAFSELPAGDRLATALELNMKAATDFFGAVFEGPLKAGGEAFDSLLKKAASVVSEAKKRDADSDAPGETPPEPHSSNDAQETDRT